MQIIEITKLKNELQKNLGQNIQTIELISEDTYKPAYLINKNYKLRLFLRQDIEKSGIDYNFEILEYLNQCNLRVPKIISDGFFEIDNYKGKIIEFIEGNSFKKTSENFKKMGVYLAKLHSIPTKKINKKSKKNSEMQRTKLISYIEAKRLKKLNTENIEMGIEMLSILKKLPKFQQEEVIINADLHKDNIVETSDGHIIPIDWDFAGLGTSTRDMADFLLNNTKNFIECKKLVKTFMEGYEQQRSLGGIELQALRNEIRLYLIEYGIEHEEDTVNRDDYNRLVRIDKELEVFA